MINKEQPHSGQPCPQPKCDGRLAVYCSRMQPGGRNRERFLRCDTCRHRPEDNKQIVPARFAPSRRTSFL